MPELNDYLHQNEDGSTSTFYWVPIDVTHEGRKRLIQEFIATYPAQNDRDYLWVRTSKPEMSGEDASMHLSRRTQDEDMRKVASIHFELPNLVPDRWSEFVREYRDVAGAPVALEAFDTNTPAFFKHYVVPAEESLLTKKEALRSFFRLHPNPTGTQFGRFGFDSDTTGNTNDDVTSFTVKRRTRSGRVRLTIHIRTSSPVEGQVEYFELAEMVDKYEDLEIANLTSPDTDNI